jgi:hypothetical protein
VLATARMRWRCKALVKLNCVNDALGGGAVVSARRYRSARAGDVSPEAAGEARRGRRRVMEQHALNPTAAAPPPLLASSARCDKDAQVPQNMHHISPPQHAPR